MSHEGFVGGLLFNALIFKINNNFNIVIFNLSFYGQRNIISCYSIAVNVFSTINNYIKATNVILFVCYQRCPTKALLVAWGI